MAFSKFSLGSSAQLICTRPTRNLSVFKVSIFPLSVRGPRNRNECSIKKLLGRMSQPDFGIVIPGLGPVGKKAGLVKRQAAMAEPRRRAKAAGASGAAERVNVSGLGRCAEDPDSWVRLVIWPVWRGRIASASMPLIRDGNRCGGAIDSD
jgi:hypothetical protein